MNIKSQQGNIDLTGPDCGMIFNVCLLVNNSINAKNYNYAKKRIRAAFGSRRSLWIL